MVNLGFLHQQGKGVAKNDTTAVALYRRAAAVGNPSGMHNLAWMLDSGQGVARKDPEQAADLIMQALDRRNEFSHRQMTQNSRAWSTEFRQALQSKLRDAGVYSGPIDGEFKDTTIAAINGLRQSRPLKSGSAARLRVLDRNAGCSVAALREQSNPLGSHATVRGHAVFRGEYPSREQIPRVVR